MRDKCGYESRPRGSKVYMSIAVFMSTSSFCSTPSAGRGVVVGAVFVVRDVIRPIAPGGARGGVAAITVISTTEQQDDPKMGVYTQKHTHNK
jgi:hypothetical protein